jgi:hypothetical protein
MISQNDTDQTSRSSIGLAVLLGVGLALSGAIMPLIPPQYRPMNFAVFGAVGLFLGARAGRYSPLISLGIMLGGKLAADLLNYLIMNPGNAEYLPMPSVYGAYLAYPLLGWCISQVSKYSTLKMLGSAAVGSLFFFLVSNFFSWRDPITNYPQTLDGLFQAYLMAVPFFSMTLISDFAFSGLLFAAHAELSRLPIAKPIPIEVRS